MEMKYKDIQAFFAVLLGCCSLLSTLFFYPEPPQTDSVKFAASLGAGWNLGNTLDAWNLPVPEDTETCWGNPKANRELFLLLKECGFSTVRLPVTWFQHLDENGYITEEWLNRVNEVVDYAVGAGLNAVLNVQHDDQDWLIADRAHEKSSCEQLSKIWTQLGERFREYDERLIFDIMNEPRVVGAETEWDGNEEGRAVVNSLNAAALKAIRDTGGNNLRRYVFITGYAASVLEENYTAIEIPDDDHVIVSLHYYPGTAHRSEFKDCEEPLGFKEKREIYKKLRGFYDTFAAKGTGVCISEFGWTDREHLDNLSGKASYVVGTAGKFGFSCFVWDNGGDFGLIDRNDNSVLYPSYLEAITGG